MGWPTTEWPRHWYLLANRLPHQMDWLTSFLTYLLTGKPTDQFSWLTNWLIDWLANSGADRLIDWPYDQLTVLPIGELVE